MTDRRASNHYAGLSAEDTVARRYTAAGADVLGRRYRAPEGEIDIVACQDDVLIFVEVKKRRRPLGADTPVSARQWRRLVEAATRFLAERCAGLTVRGCRFDAAILLPDGALQIFEDAHRPGLA